MAKLAKDEYLSALGCVHEYGVNLFSREIFFHSQIISSESNIDEPGVDYRSSVYFIKNLSLLNAQSKDNILIHLHSCGGYWDYGMAIYDAIKASKSPIAILAYAHARSMSSIILQAAGKRVLMPDCTFLAHHGTLGYEDRYTPVITSVKFTEQYETPRMLEVYAQKCIKGDYFKRRRMSKKKVSDFICRKFEEKGNWILTSQEAVHYGFADGVFGKKGFETLEKIRR